MLTFLAQQTQPSKEELAQLWIGVLWTVGAVLAVLLVVALTWSILRGRRIRRELRETREKRRREQLVAQGSLGGPPTEDPATLFGAKPAPDASEPWKAAGERVDKPNDGPVEPGSDSPNPPWAKEQDGSLEVPPWMDEDGEEFEDEDEEEDEEDERDNWWKRGEEPPY